MTTTSHMNNEPSTAHNNLASTRAALAIRWQTLQLDQPKLRIRDAAAALQVSECELLDTKIGVTAHRLVNDIPSLLHALVEVGRCMALTRNAHAVSEVRGQYGGVELGPHAGQVVGTGIDLRVFPMQWVHLFDVNEPDPSDADRRRRSIHGFDAMGTAVHKIYLEPDGDAATWDAIVTTRRVPDAGSPHGTVAFGATVTPPAVIADDAVDAGTLIAEWDAMQDTHEFFLLLRKHRVTRTQALRLVGPTRAYQVANEACGQLLHAAAAAGLKIMIFVGNGGCLQVFSGAVAKIVAAGPWLNVMDPDFNLHLRADQIASSWVVAKPTSSGTVSSLELYDASGQTIAMCFVKRDDRAQVEDTAWRELLGALPAATAVVP